jgi:hypothetical protein
MADDYRRDRESQEELNRATQANLSYMQAQTRQLAEQANLSRNILDTLKEELGIRTRRSTEESDLLEINKQITKEITNQKFGLSTSTNLQRQFLRNENLILKAKQISASLESNISVAEKKKAENAAKYFIQLSEQQKLINKLEKDISEGISNDYQSLALKKDEQAQTEQALNYVYKQLSADGKRLALTKAQIVGLGEVNKQRAKDLQIAEQIEKSLGVTGRLLNFIGTVPGLGKFASDAYQAVIDEQKSLKESGEELMSLSNSILFGSRKLGESIKDTLLNEEDVTLGILFFREMAIQIKLADERQTSLQRQLGISRLQVAGINFDFKLIAASSLDTYLTTGKLLESFQEFSGQLGFAVDYSGQTLETFTTLNKRLGISVEQATALTSLLKLQGNNTEDQLENLVKQIGVFNTLNGKAFNTKQVLQDIANISASIQVSLGLSTDELAAATLQAKLLGLNLAEVDKIADSLLQFETSIENELKAELLIGKELNLERARLFAINNDLVRLGEELEKQNINFFEYSKLNRIQQQALAETIGMGREEMSQMLLNQQRQVMTNEEIASQLEGQELSNFKQLTFQESLNTALEKMRDIFTTIAEGPLGVIAGFFADILSNSYVINSLLGAMVGYLTMATIKSSVLLAKSVGQAISAIFAGSFQMGPAGLAFAGASIAALLTALTSASSTAKSVNDAIISPSGEIITTNPNDYLIATQDPKGLATSMSKGQTGSNKIEQLLEQILMKNSNVYMDSSKIGYAEAFSYSKL